MTGTGIKTEKTGRTGTQRIRTGPYLCIEVSEAVAEFPNVIQWTLFRVAVIEEKDQSSVLMKKVGVLHFHWLEDLQHNSAIPGLVAIIHRHSRP